MAKKRRYYSNLNRKPREGEYTTYDKRTGIRIWNTDATKDFWGMQVHKNNVATPEATLYMNYVLPIEDPITTSGGGGISYQTGTWFVQPDENNNVGSIFYSDDYVNGLYTEATSSQIAAYVPVLGDSTHTIDFQDLDPGSTYLIATLSATDPAGEGLLWSITAGNDDGYFSVDPAQGKLYITAPEEITNDTEYELTVKVTSYFPGNPYDTATATIEVTDVNDAPEITNGSSFSVDENTTSVTTVTATDAENDTITYSISGGADSSLFSINSSSGALSFKSAPDYESPGDADKNNVYVVEVKASDGVLYDTQTLSITVNDVNEAPTITSSNTPSVSEGATAAMTVTATDPDNDDITFSLNGGADVDLFAIDSKTGALTFKSAPDYESPTDSDKNNTYVVGVKASDGSLYDTDTITVTVTDVAETPDTFGTLQLWLDASDASSITHVANEVSQWNDKSGNNRHFTQSNASFKPIYNSSGLDGALPSLEFNVSALNGDYMLYVDGGTSLWDFLINATSTKAVIFVVLQQTVRDSGGNTNSILAVNGGNTAWQFGISSRASMSTFKAESDHLRVTNNYARMDPVDIPGFNTGIIVHVTYEPAASPRVNLYTDNTLRGSSSDLGTMSGSTHLGDTMYMGTNVYNYGLGNSASFRGHISEVLIYSECSDTSVPYNYLADKWNI